MTFDPLADFFSGLDTQASSIRERNRPDEGSGIYALETYGPKKTEKGYITNATLRVVRLAPGSTRKQGEEVEIAWFTYKGQKEGGENEKARARDFVNALLSRPAMTPASKEAHAFAQPTQPGRGLLIQIDAKKNTYKRKDGSIGEGVNYTFVPVPGQSNETVAKMRAQVEAWAGAQAAAEVPSAPADPRPHAVTGPAPAGLDSLFPNPAATVSNTAPVNTTAPAAGSPLSFLFKP